MFQPDKLADLIGKESPWNDPRSLEGLIAWLETKFCCEEYDPKDNQRCLYTQYGCFAFGFSNVGDRAFSRTTEFIRNYNGDPERFGAFDGQIEYPLPHTFGAALERARAAHNEVR